jgi:hypothetical protein
MTHPADFFLHVTEPLLTFREWVLIEDRNQERWDGLLREAFAFVRGRELSAG